MDFFPSAQIGNSKISTGAQKPRDYLAYLQTREWRQTRLRALKRSGFQCSRCGSKRALQVHHLTYERMGSERDADVEVLCAGCHEHEHAEQEAPHDFVRLYIVLAKDVIAQDGPFASVADFTEALKLQAAKRHIPYDADKLSQALRVLSEKYPNLVMPAPAVRAFLDQQIEEPISAFDARLILSKLIGRIGTPIKTIPTRSSLTLRGAERLKAAKMVAQEIQASIDACEALERTTADSSLTPDSGECIR